jgi:hypothetical protein
MATEKGCVVSVGKARRQWRAGGEHRTRSATGRQHVRAGHARTHADLTCVSRAGGCGGVPLVMTLEGWGGVDKVGSSDPSGTPRVALTS